MSKPDDDWSDDSSSDSETSDSSSDSDSSDSYSLQFAPYRLTKVDEDEIWEINSSDDDVEKIDVVANPRERVHLPKEKRELLNCLGDPECSILAKKVGQYMEILPISTTIPTVVVEDEILPIESSHASGSLSALPETGMNLLQIMSCSANEAAAAYFQEIPDVKSTCGSTDQISQAPCINANSEATRKVEPFLQDLQEQKDEGATSTNEGVEDGARNQCVQDSEPTSDTGLTLNNITLQTSEQLLNNKNNTTEESNEMRIDGETFYETVDMLEEGIKINANEAANDKKIIEELFSIL